VGSQEIRSEAFRQAMEQRRIGGTVAEKEALLQELVDRAALVQRALDQGLDRDAEVRRSLENLLIGRLRETEMDPLMTAAAPGPEEVQKAYEANLDAWKEPAMRRGAIIFIAMPPRTSEPRKAELRSRIEAARTKALALLEDDPAIRGFGAVAVEYSEDQATRYRGGDTGWVGGASTGSRFDPAVIQALFATSQPGDVSDVIETSRGYYLVKLLEVKPARVKPLAEVQKGLQQNLKRQNLRDVELEWKQQARKAVKIELFPEALEAVPAPASSAPEPEGPPVLK
jgi:parvulin-like peptidyl-prolyl isomerase